jgi:hypothetical protein
MNVEHRCPVAVLFEVVAYHVLNDELAVMEVGQLQGVQQSVVGVRRKICRKQNLFDDHVFSPSDFGSGNVRLLKSNLCSPAPQIARSQC